MQKYTTESGIVKQSMLYYLIMNILEKISHPADLAELSHSELSTLCSEIRSEIIRTTAENGGHLASNLGSVELTVAMLRSFDLPSERIIWDVGHQSYAYKLLTGRQKEFAFLR